MIRLVPFAAAAWAAAALMCAASSAVAQSATPPSPGPGTPAAGAPAPPVATGADSLSDFAWLDGCWIGNVNQRDFREHWMPPRGGLALGVSQMVMGGKSVSYEYLRIESRQDGIYYVDVPSDGKEE